MIVEDRDDDTTVVRCPECGYYRRFARILSTVEALRLRCRCSDESRRETAT